MAALGTEDMQAGQQSPVDQPACPRAAERAGAVMLDLIAKELGRLSSGHADVTTLMRPLKPLLPWNLGWTPSGGNQPVCMPEYRGTGTIYVQEQLLNTQLGSRKVSDSWRGHATIY